eukprot:SRR837773.9028.p2 GENE.SRR837773.9028~~SRR837773.9028.p2  ORF type:complete len:141 (+),score=52.21 SRR837773.9028:30-425(+)
MAAVPTVDAQAAAALPAGRRVNFGLFQQATVGTAVRVDGRMGAFDDATKKCVVTTTDGGSLQVTAPEVPMAGVAAGSFIEVVGTKAGDGELKAVGFYSFPKAEDVDAELWEEAVKLTQLPQLRELFAPVEA